MWLQEKKLSHLQVIMLRRKFSFAESLGWTEPYPWINSISWGCSSSSLRISILLDIDWTVCIDTFSRVCKLLNAAQVLSTEEDSSPFTSWFLKCVNLFSYSILNRSPACKWPKQLWLSLAFVYWCKFLTKIIPLLLCIISSPMYKVYLRSSGDFQTWYYKILQSNSC